MPVRRRSNKRRAGLSEPQLRWLRGQSTFYGLVNSDDVGWELFEREETLAELWHENSEWVVAEHVAEKPGTRPKRWWAYDSPRAPCGAAEPRQRHGGTGAALYEALPVFVPQWEFGVPREWLTARNIHFYPTDAAPIDPNDPPLFESEAAYLERHGLLLPGEKQRLKAADFEPEAVMLDE